MPCMFLPHSSFPAPHHPNHSDRVPKYMTPADVEEIMRRLWDNEWPLLSLVYDSEQAAGSAGAAPAKGTRPEDGYKRFFIRYVAVTPNKFRPPSVMSNES
jgi:hypothetical protein